MKAPKVYVFLLLTIIILSLTSFTACDADNDKYSRDYVTYKKSIENFESSDFIVEVDNPLIEKNEFETTSDNSGTLIRGWIENTKENLVVEPFTATREVLDHYDIEPIYTVSGEITPYPNEDLNSISAYKCQQLEWSKDIGFWRDFFWGNRWPNVTVESNSFQDTSEFSDPGTDYGWTAFQGFGLWNRHIVHPNYIDSYSIWVPHRFDFLYHDGSKEIPVYVTEEYTAYHNTLYEITDYEIENWSRVTIPITIHGENGYEGLVEVDAEVDDERIDLEIENELLDVSTEVTTEINVRAPSYLIDGDSKIEIKVSDDKRTENKFYEICFETEEKPPVENQIIRQWDSEIKPNEEKDSSETYKKLLGVGGNVNDSDTGDGINEPLMTVDGDSFSGETTGEGGAGGISVSRSDGSYIYAHERWPGQTHTFNIKAEKSGYFESNTKTRTDDSNSDSTAQANFSLTPKY